MVARHAMDYFLHKTGARHNGLPMPPDILRALDELDAAAAVSHERQNLAADLPAPGEFLTVGQAARRLGVSNRTVERQATAGLLPARRVRRAWLILMNGDAMAQQATAATQAEAPPRYRVTGALITVKTASLAGIVPGRTGYAFVSLYKGALLPADVPEESIKRHLEMGAIEEVAA